MSSATYVATLQRIETAFLDPATKVATCQLSPLGQAVWHGQISFPKIMLMMHEWQRQRLSRTSRAAGYDDSDVRRHTPGEHLLDPFILRIALKHFQIDACARGTVAMWRLNLYKRFESYG